METDLLSGKLQPKLWVPGYVVIFRTDGKFGKESGKAGRLTKSLRISNWIPSERWTLIKVMRT